MKNILIVLGILLCLEVATRVAVKKIHFFKKIEYERVKGMLANDGNQAKILSKYLPSQYTLLSLNPEYRNEKGIRIHNALGYRGEEFLLEKEKNIYRILCLGGSTTYCSYIDNNEDTYPAILQRELNKQVRKKQFSSFPYDSVQVINAGIEGANMFLIMAQYQYKYRYFNPDMVVIHEGINDGYAYMGDVYTTDYTHLRTNIFSFKPLPVWLRGFMKSELFSMLACLSVFRERLMINKIVDDNLYPEWHKVRKGKGDYFEKKYNAFYQNSVMLSKQIKGDSIEVIFFPMLYNKEVASQSENSEFKKAVDIHRDFWREIALSTNSQYISVEPDTISARLFFDACHLNKDGNSIKASIVSRKIESVIAASEN